MPPIKKIFSNSTNTFAPNWEKNAHNHKKCPQLKKTFSNSTNTFAPNLKKCPQLNKNAPNFSQICQSQMGLKKEL